MVSWACALRALPRFARAAVPFVVEELVPVDGGGNDGLVVVIGDATSWAAFVTCVRSDTIDADRARLVELLRNMRSQVHAYR